jgi:primosomal protein N' (replication factor Y)
MSAMQFLQEIKILAQKSKDKTQISGPISAPVARKAGYHRSYLFIQATTRPVLKNLLKKVLPEIENIKLKQKVRWSVDVDPLEMI